MHLFCKSKFQQNSSFECYKFDNHLELVNTNIQVSEVFYFIEHTSLFIHLLNLSDSRQSSLYSLVCDVPLIAPVIARAVLY